MFTRMLLLFCLLGATQPASERPGPGFGLLFIEVGPNPPADPDARQQYRDEHDRAWVYDVKTGKTIGGYRRGERIAKPFDKWRVVDFIDKPKRWPYVLVINVDTQETREIDMVHKRGVAPTRPVQVH